ncbi:MAG: hypothetical protein Fues2KO_13020 [Fuerstiella sp.]
MTRQLVKIPEPPPPALPFPSGELADIESLNDATQLALFVNELMLICSFSRDEFRVLVDMIRELSKDDDPAVREAALVVNGKLLDPRFVAATRGRHFWLMSQLLAAEYPTLRSVHQTASHGLPFGWRGEIEQQIQVVDEWRLVFSRIRQQLGETFDPTSSVKTQEFGLGIPVRTFIYRRTLHERLYDLADVMVMLNREQRMQALKWRLMLLDILDRRERSKDWKPPPGQAMTDTNQQLVCCVASRTIDRCGVAANAFCSDKQFQIVSRHFGCNRWPAGVRPLDCFPCSGRVPA